MHFTAAPPRTCGKTNLVPCTRSSRANGANRATHWCQCCSQLLANEQAFAFDDICVVYPVAAPSSPPSPLDSSRLPMWPPLGCFWPSQVGVCCYRSVGRRGFPVESAAARICREAGVRAVVNVFVRNLDLGVVDRLDARRLEIVLLGFLFSVEPSWSSTRRWFLLCAKTARPEEEPRQGMAQCRSLAKEGQDASRT